MGHWAKNRLKQAAADPIGTFKRGREIYSKGKDLYNEGRAFVQGSGSAPDPKRRRIV